MARIDRYLEHAVQNRASDIHFSSDEPVRLRIDGDLVALDEAPLSTDELWELFSEFLGEGEAEKFQKNRNLDKSHSIPSIGNFRVNLFFTRRGMSGVIRTIPSKVPTIEELGLPEIVRTLAELPKGLVLVTGPTGSGKSTTLSAMINHINTNFPYHILTVEDPVEFVHPCKSSLVNQREIGSSCHTFSDALKYALREDPDVILVGEMRDLETIGLALTAAETGHLVFGTLHTRGAGASIDRIIDSFPANQQSMVRAMLAESLMGVISQSLLKRKDGKGRAAAYEIMVVNHAISNLIREGKTFQIPSVMQTSRKDGMVLLSQHVRELLQSGVIAEDEAAQYLEENQGKQVKLPAKPSPTAKPKGPIGFAPKPLDAPKPQAAPAAKPPLPGVARPAVLAPKPAAPPGARPFAPSPLKPPAAAVARPAPPARPPAPGTATPIAPDLAEASVPGAEEGDLLSVDLTEDGANAEMVLKVDSEDGGLQEVSETTGTHDLNKLRSQIPPARPSRPVPPPPPTRKVG